MFYVFIFVRLQKQKYEELNRILALVPNASPPEVTLFLETIKNIQEFVLFSLISKHKTFYENIIRGCFLKGEKKICNMKKSQKHTLENKLVNLKQKTISESATNQAFR